jgi:hypothetical protein
MLTLELPASCLVMDLLAARSHTLCMVYVEEHRVRLEACGCLCKGLRWQCALFTHLIDSPIRASPNNGSPPRDGWP